MKTELHSFRTIRNYVIALGYFIFIAQSLIAQSTCLIPSRVEVIPVFFVPQGGTYPVQSQKDSLMHYLYWAQTRYFEMLKFRSTFTIADSVPNIYTGIQNDAFYQSQTDGGASVYSDELLSHYGYSRFNCPYIFLVIYMSPSNLFPNGGGRPLNAGFNTGGGIIILSSFDLDNTPNFESTLQHELGHSFGLPHVDSNGYDMNTNESIMSYNLNQHTNYFTPSATPGILIPENLRDLSLNKLVFPEMYFDSTLDIPNGYIIPYPIATLGIFDIPNQLNYGLQVTTTSGEAFGSAVTNIVQHQIKPSIAGMGLTYDSINMWHSGIVTWAVAEVHFPFIVPLDRIGVHSQHSGQYHEADSVKIETYNNGNYSLITLNDLTDIDQYISFGMASDSVWRFSFRAGTSNYVTIRGLEFFIQDETLFPPVVPYTIQNPFFNQLPERPVLANPINNFIATTSTLNLDWTCNQAIYYGLQIDTTKDFCSPLVNIVLSNNNFSYSIPFGNTKYYWRVKGLNNAGCGFEEWSEIRAFSSGLFTDISEQKNNDDFVMYPNPVSDKLFFSNLNPDSQTESVTIYNTLMKEVKIIQIGQNNAVIDLTDFKNGIYFLKFKTVNSQEIYRSIIKL